MDAKEKGQIKRHQIIDDEGFNGLHTGHNGSHGAHKARNSPDSREPAWQFKRLAVDAVAAVRGWDKLSVGDPAANFETAIGDGYDEVGAAELSTADEHRQAMLCLW
ncbi:hypothetical protein GCM10011410_19600 [Hoyosella rhizosphaerae]|uniref:Uncharacterized protein n=1 Tax=Hoyosella rhizosphaerae TaxID=1755582 RepID=A0A916UDF9_9ACTN|nr:hypothetical protein GCM10011410_19600 [Hoyosella rhizosphaerae]